MTNKVGKSIGVFDSGVGGLTVLKKLIEKFPDESFLYLGDTARLPYGTKSPETIRRYSIQNIEFLQRHQVKCIVVACNSASSQIPETHLANLKIFTVISPGARTALAISKAGRIGILGTRATINSQIYQNTLTQLAEQEKRSLNLFPVACPLFVPLAEEGWHDDPLTNLIAYRYLHELKSQNVDCVILGCTHYPILSSSIEKVLGKSTHLVDSGEAVAAELMQSFNLGEIPRADSSMPRKIQICSTDSSPAFEKIARDLIPGECRVDFLLVDVEQTYFEES